MAGFSVNPDHVLSTVTDLRAAHKGIVDALSTLDDAAGVLACSWDGDARTAFSVSHQGWAADMAAMADILAAAATAAENAAQAYEDADSRVGRTWSI
ncbi:MAG: WXG100 family type VII secretion target [Micrococcales bacterium]|nr:WXG100 family type VII secretion target [Micrococcales bacterium]